MNKPINSLEKALRLAYAHRIKELLEWAHKQTEEADDPYGLGTAHFLRTGGLVIGFYGYDEVEYERVLCMAEKSKGWINVFEGDTLTKTHLDLTDQVEMEIRLNQGIENAIDAYSGGQSLDVEYRERLYKNIVRAVRWATNEIYQMPEHLQPFAKRMLDMYQNGNVVLSFEPTEEASEKLKKEFWLKCRGRELVFGIPGNAYMCQVNIGTLKTGVRLWPEIEELIQKASL